jgi:ABC-type methionine transport system ATPase subunit
MLRSLLRGSSLDETMEVLNLEDRMPTRTLRLIYPPSLLRRPIINQVILDFEVSINILQAQVNLEEGWLEVQISGENREVARAMAWLEEIGIQVIEQN